MNWKKLMQECSNVTEKPNAGQNNTQEQQKSSGQKYDSIVEQMAQDESKKSIAVDLDGTLAEYTGWKGINHIGKPLKPMVNRIYKWISEGYQVKIFTARAADPRSYDIIRNWLRANGLPDMVITNVKDSSMKEIWDDLAVRVKKNTGERE